MRKKLLILLTIIISLQVSAQNEKGLIELEKTLVTVDRFEITERKTAKNVTVVTKEEIKNSKALNVIDLLRTIPGIFVSSGYTNDGVIDLRGQGEAVKNNVLILVDGVSLNTIDMSGPDLSIIDVGNIERIEVVPSGGVIYGDKAVGGVVNIITDKKSNKLKIESGSYGLLNYGLSINKTLGSTSFTANLSKNTIVGYRKNSESEKNNLSLGLSHSIDERNKLTFSYAYNDSDLNFPGSLTETQLENDRTDSISGYGNSVVKKNNYNFTYEYGGNSLKIENKLNYATKSNNFDWSGWIEERTTETLINNTKVKYNFGKNSLVAGLDYNKGTSLVEAKETNKVQVGIYALDSLNMSENLSLSAGYRNEKISLGYPTGKEKNYSKDLYSLGLNYLYSDTGSLYLSKELNYRTPTTDEYYSSYSGYNENLEPQASDVIEFGIREYLGNTYMKASYYKTETKNEIFYNPTTWANENIEGETSRKGLELSAKTFVGNLAISQAYSAAEAKITEGIFKDKLIPWISKERYILSVLYKLNDLNLNTEFIHTGEMVALSDWQNTAKKEKAYNVINFNVGYKLGEFNLYGGIKNITNEKYNEYALKGTKFYPAPERNYFAGVSYEF